MEYGAPGDHSVRDGWLNRYLQLTARPGDSELRAVGLQGLLPRALRGSYPVLAVPALGARRSADLLDRFEPLYQGGGAVETAGRQTIAALRRLQEIVSAPSEGTAGYPDSVFGQRLRAIAQLARANAGLEVAALDYGGWDHHANQGGADGQHARMLQDLAAALAAFHGDLSELASKTLVLCMTEFGRTVRENGNDGTDHGRGGGMFLLGGGVRGGKVHGDWRGLDSKDLVAGRDLPVTTDFRDIFASSLEAVLDFGAPEGFFPGHSPRRLRLF